MLKVKWLSEDSFRKPSVVVIIFSACFAFWLVDFWKPYNQAKGEHNFLWDVFGYYSYLPAYFCNDGSFEFGIEIGDHNPPGPLKTHVPKYTYGMSFLYSPFFALAYKIAINQHSPLTGFSEPFVTCIKWGSIIYVLIGMLFLRRFLLYYFSEAVTAITLTGVLFGTMLFLYTYVHSEMSHSYLFFLFSAALYFIHRWHHRISYMNSIWIGLVMGLITLIRPTEVFMFMFFIFWNVTSIKTLREKFFLFLRNYKHVLLIGFIMGLWWVPQLLFYKQHTGQYFYFSYMRERFFWGDPQIFNVLLSYRKGWITYTPLVFMAFVGLFFMKKDFPLSRYTIIIVLGAALYVFSCWWDWQFGGSFGARSFCQQIAVLSIPLASFIEFIYYSPKRFFLKPLVGLISMVFICSCICLNIGHTYQYAHNKRVHPWAMTKKAYWMVIRQYQFNEQQIDQYWHALEEPDFLKYSDGSDRSK